MSPLDAVPNEVLEHIAFFSASQQLLGPPSSIPILLTLNRKINGVLTPAITPHLYARIFVAKFDIAAPLRRLGPSALTASVLMQELQSRCVILKRIRAAKDCFQDKSPDASTDDVLDDLLWTAYLMMLENDGKNAAQLKNYANIGEWLTKYWLDPKGGSLSASRHKKHRWPSSDNRAALAMWLLWFFFDPGKYTLDVEMKRKITMTIKPYALGAHKYPLAAVHWTDFRAVQANNILISPPDEFVDNDPSSDRPNVEMNARDRLRSTTKALRYFSLEPITVSPLPIAMPAILCHLALLAKTDQVLPSLLETAELYGDIHGLHNSTSTSDAFVAYPGIDDATKQSERWDCQWYRCLSLGGGVEQVFGAGGSTATDAENLLRSGTYRLGSIEGVWEGMFSYTEFTSYASWLAGAPPQALQASLIVQHRQTWKLREYHLLADVPYSSDAPDFASRDPSTGMPVVDPFPSTDQHNAQGLAPSPLPEGVAIRAHLPPSSVLTMSESADTLTMTLPEAYISPPQGMAPFTTESTEAAERLVQSHQTKGKTVKYVYKKYCPDDRERRSGLEGDVLYAARVKDVILIGEGHSSWGEFKLMGRIRPLDGFVYLAKEYTEGDRGRWLYRGYLVGAGGGEAGSALSNATVGSSDGYLVGRWRDTLSPPNQHGYEGCFGMTRRR